MFYRSVILIAQCCLVLAACDWRSDSPNESGDADGSTVLRRGNGGEPGTLDPTLAEDVHAFAVLTDLYEGLVTAGADGQLLPGVAESWSISDDGRVYTFTLRENARWSNGDPVVAADFVRSFQRATGPGSKSPYGFLLEPIQNYQLVNAGSKSADELGVRADSDRKLTITLGRQTGYWLSVLTMPIAFPNHLYAGTETISNGAYKLTKHQVGGTISLQKNPHYWNAQSVELDEVVYFPIVDPVSEYNMYRTGELDITFAIPPETIRATQQQMPDQARIAPTLALYYMAFDLTEPPLNDPRLRQALSMAIDREQLVALIGRGERAAYGVVPPGVTNHANARYDWANSPRSNREQHARNAYKDAGYDSASPLKLKLTYDVGDIHERVALAVASMWKEVLGVDVALDNKEWKYFLDTRDDRPSWQVMRFSWTGDYNDASTFTDIFRSNSPQNLPRYSNAEYDRLLNEAAVEIDLARRMTLMTEAEALLINDYPIAPLYFYVSKHMVKPYILGFEDNVLDRHPSKYISIDRP